MTTIKCPNARAICITFEEHDILVKAEEILRQIQDAFGSETTITSLETGEIIEPRELARTRSIIDFISTYRMVEIS